MHQVQWLTKPASKAGARAWLSLAHTIHEVYPLITLAWALKQPIFIVQRATAPKNGVAFHQGFMAAIRLSLITSYNAKQRLAVTYSIKTYGLTAGLLF